MREAKDVVDRQLDSQREVLVLCRACDNLKKQSEPEGASEMVGRVKERNRERRCPRVGL